MEAIGRGRTMEVVGIGVVVVENVGITTDGDRGCVVENVGITTGCGVGMDGCPCVWDDRPGRCETKVSSRF